MILLNFLNYTTICLQFSEKQFNIKHTYTYTVIIATFSFVVPIFFYLNKKVVEHWSRALFSENIF